MIVDTNVYLARWPTRRLPYDETRRLVAKLKERGVTSAWAGSFDGLLHHDIAAVNARLVAECREHGEGLLVPFGSINPKLPDWQDDLRRCIDDYGMKGIRLHPNYHGYTLDEPVAGRLLAMCAKHQLVVQLVLKMEDERTQHRLMRVQPVDTGPLTRLLEDHPKLKLVILNGLGILRNDALSKLAETGQVWFDIAMLEGIGGIERLLKSMTPDRIVFGSYFPFFYFDAAMLKLRESELAVFHREAIQHTNAEQLLVS